jgi:hypothetical protein
MANQTIAAGQTLSLTQPLSNGSNLDFLNPGTASGVLILADSAAYSAFSISTSTVGGTLVATAGIGGSIVNFMPGAYPGILGDQVTVQVLGSLFSNLDIAANAAAENAAFANQITFAAESGIQYLIQPGGTVTPTPGANFTLDANTQLVVYQIAQSLFGAGALNASHATLNLAFAERPNPNSNNPYIDGVFTTEAAVNPCFAAGTRILTPAGEVPVEALVPGDRIIGGDGEEPAIVWIGRREIEFARHPRPETVRPVVFEAGALADGVPARPLALSPDHGLLLDGVLVPAKELINWTSIRQETSTERVTYYHLELPRHGVIFAEAVAAESFLDTGHRGVFDNAVSSAAVLPDEMQRRREAESCAPLCTGGPALAAIRRRIAARQVGIRLAGHTQRGNPAIGSRAMIQTSQSKA